MLRLGCAFALGFLATGAIAADLPPYGALPPQPVISPQPLAGWEIRAGAMAHDPSSPERGSADLNGELLFPRWFAPTDPYWNKFIPRFDVGFPANFAGKTSNAYAGFAWTFDLWDHFFIEGQLGGAVNNGKTGPVVPPGHNKVGCNWSFHESGSVGYRLTQNWSIMGTIEHFSNAGICTQNRGVTNAGVRVGYQF